MTVQDLLDLLDGVDPDTEVRLAHQPSWPFEYSIGTVELVGANDAEIEEAENALARARDLTPEERETARAELDRLSADNQQIVYIAEGSQLGYLPGSATEALGWSR